MREVALNAKIPEDLDREFRLAIGKRFGMKRGNMQKAVIEAVRAWVENGRKK